MLKDGIGKEAGFLLSPLVVLVRYIILRNVNEVQVPRLNRDKWS